MQISKYLWNVQAYYIVLAQIVFKRFKKLVEATNKS